VLRPSTKNDKYGVQRMEMLAIYFALADNQWLIKRMASNQRKKQQQQLLVINVRSDSKTSVEQLQGISEIRDSLMQRICAAIKKLLEKMMSFMIIFNHLDRTRNIAGLLLEQRRRKEEEKFLMHQYLKQYYCCSIDGLLSDPLLPGHNYSLTTA
jgi:hypothetical protein